MPVLVALQTVEEAGNKFIIVFGYEIIDYLGR